MDYYDDNDKDNHSGSDDSRPDPSDNNGDYWQTNNQQNGYQPGSYSQRGDRPVRQSNRMALISMLCGLFGVLSLFCCIAFPLSILLGVAGIVLSFLSKKGGPFTGLAIAGLVLGIIAVLLGVAECVYLILLNSMLQDPATANLFEQLIEQYGAQ